MNELEPPRPGKPAFAADFVREPEDERAGAGLLRQQCRLRREPLGEQ